MHDRILYRCRVCSGIECDRADQKGTAQRCRQKQGGIKYEADILVHPVYLCNCSSMALRIPRAQLLALATASRHLPAKSIAVWRALGFTNPSILNNTLKRSHSFPSHHLLSQRSLSEKQLYPGRRAKATRLIHTTPRSSADARSRNSDPNAVAVVIGASRGIGLAITQKLVTRWKGRIVATCRDPNEAGALSALWQFMPDRFSVIQLDVEDETSVSLPTHPSRCSPLCTNLTSSRIYT